MEDEVVEEAVEMSVVAEILSLVVENGVKDSVDRRNSVPSHAFFSSYGKKM